VTGASDTLDPIAAAEAGIAGSKHLIASVADDLSQQERWLAHYRLAERRRARRLKFQELIYWLELRRRRVVRWATRLALITLRLARTAALFLWRTAVALLVMLRSAAIAGFLWLRPRVYALMLALAALLTASLAWTLVQARAIARVAWRGASIAAAWLMHQSQILGTILWRWLIAAWGWTWTQFTRLARASIKGASIGAAWSAAQSRSLALWLRRETTRLVSWTRTKAGHFSRASLATASLGFSWAPAANNAAGSTHRALVPRRGTALISFEPQAMFPPYTLGDRVPINSRADRASP
jgi:hypothetical protein